MLMIDATGGVVDERVKSALNATIERGAMRTVNGIIVHQTGAATAESTLASYKNSSANGAHFLIEREGTIYQTASLFKKTWHIGKLKARCVLEKTCAPAELKVLKHFNPAAEHKREMAKKAPARYPSNEDSIGIELVGEALPRGGKLPEDKKIYQSVTNEQNVSLKWLVTELSLTLGVPMSEIFRHPDVSRKNPTEASTARW